jgi:hypothetical protein
MSRWQRYNCHVTKLLALAVVAAPLAAQLNTIQTVYLLPMNNGLDQHLANRLAAAGVFQVVTDPLKADAVFTDRLGEAFEVRFAELYITPEEEKKRAEEKKARAEEKRARERERKAKGLPAEEEDAAEEQADSGKLVDKGAPRSTFGRGRGTLFLVERKSRSVVWSVFDAPRDSSPRELDRLAGRVAERLKRAQTGK